MNLKNATLIFDYINRIKNVDSSENSTNDEIDNCLELTPPFSPKPFSTPPTSRVTGLDEELTAGLLKRPESEEEKRERYHDKIYGSLI
jgi:hypothetical protein